MPTLPLSLTLIPHRIPSIHKPNPNTSLITMADQLAPNATTNSSSAVATAEAEALGDLMARIDTIGEIFVAARQRLLPTDGTVVPREMVEDEMPVLLERARELVALVEEVAPLLGQGSEEDEDEEEEEDEEEDGDEEEDVTLV